MTHTLKTLVTEEVARILREASYSEEDIPKVFWMVTSVDEYSLETVEQLATGELKGVKGISDTKGIVVQWLGVARNAVLVIPAKEFLEMNNVSRVMYDNPHYLVSKGMAGLFRLFNRTPKNDYDWQGLMQTVMDYIKGAGKKSKPPSKAMATILYNIDYGPLAPSWYGRNYKVEKPSINTLKDLATWIQKATVDIASEREKYIVSEAEALTANDWMPLVVEAVKMIGQTYQDEGEWLVKDEAMSVPKNSTLFIALNVDPKSISDQARQEYAEDPEKDDHWASQKLQAEKTALKRMDLAKSYGLDKHYRLKFVSMKKFDEYKQKYWARQASQ